MTQSGMSPEMAALLVEMEEAYPKIQLPQRRTETYRESNVPAICSGGLRARLPKRRAISGVGRPHGSHIRCRCLEQHRDEGR